MADNIKIIGSILSTQKISRYNEEDIRLLTSQTIQESFGKQNDYIEYFIYDAGNNLLNTNYNYKSFKSPNTSFVTTSGSLPIIEIDPIKDLQNLGYSSGEFKVQYNFFNNQVSDSNADLFLKEISADRTELRIGSTILTNAEIETAATNLINQYTGSAYFVDYVINFGNNIQVTAVNVALNKIESGYEILFKLYQPLPINISEKVNLWVVKEKINPYVFDINLDKLILAAALPQLRGPNFNIDVPNQNNIATSYQTYTSLINSVQNLSTSSYQQLLSLITSQSISINVDYTDYTNFIFFSSAKQRLVNFYNKVKQIEDYKSDIVTYQTSTSSLSSSFINNTTASINDIITNFDGFEYYLYFESGSLTSSLDYGINPYPKSTSSKPFTLYSTSSILVNTWYSAATSSADDYDDYNSNYIINTLPEFVKEDDNNNQYITFLNMVGHYFDNIWIYLQAVTDVNLANNNLNKGVSKDLVYHVLQSLGTKLYNQYGDSDNTDFLIGGSGSVNFDNNFTSTGSYLNAIPHKDLLAESYKRIYHNLPLLLKTKGTTYGLQTLISTFGITGSILKVKEYGGDTKSGLLSEHNDNKVRVVSNDVIGNVLSPYVSVQQPSTSSTLFRTNDSHYIDISFSPQEKIDIFASASIAATNATWSLDDFIGDPRYQYSGSYTTLVTEKEKYYSPLSASIVPFTGSAGSGSIGATDYNSFIRLIQFFDNSLFKMLKDFAPTRANLSTGITIASPILERNKWSFANPSSTSKLNTNQGEISGSSISTEYNNLYYNLTGSKVAYYDGNITGSKVNVYDYFENSNPNPYLFNTASWNIQHSVTESANLNKFLHSDFNVIFNNVSSSLISTTRRSIQYLYGTANQRIIGPAELQDSYESLSSYQLSRYEGSKLSSLDYNNYASASSTYVGDISFGKTAVIDRNSIKLGLFTEVTANRFLPNRNNAALKYLVDIDGNLTELNLRNKHWQEVQNMFVANNTSSISLFNNQLYGNQKTTNGEKIIFDSGYSYNPILYFGITGSNLDSTIYFQSLSQLSSRSIEAKNSLLTNAYISGSSTPAYPLTSGYVKRIFDSEITDSDNAFTPGTISSYPTYSIQETGNYSIIASMPFTYEVPTSPQNEATWSLQVYKKSGVTETLITSSSLYFTAGNPSTVTLNFDEYSGNTFVFTLSEALPLTTLSITYARANGYSEVSCAGPVHMSDHILTGGTPAVLNAGTTYAEVVSGVAGDWDTIHTYKLGSSISILGYGTFINGETFDADGTTVTVSINTDCQYYNL